MFKYLKIVLTENLKNNSEMRLNLKVIKNELNKYFAAF